MNSINQVNQQRIERMTELLNESLSPSHLSIIDNSHLHAGHAGAKTGLGHFELEITSQKFSGLAPLKRHQLVYNSLGDMMQTDIHALSIKASH